MATAATGPVFNLLDHVKIRTLDGSNSIKINGEKYSKFEVMYEDTKRPDAPKRVAVLAHVIGIHTDNVSFRSNSFVESKAPFLQTVIVLEPGDVVELKVSVRENFVRTLLKIAVRELNFNNSDPIFAFADVKNLDEFFERSYLPCIEVERLDEPEQQITTDGPRLRPAYKVNQASSSIPPTATIAPAFVAPIPVAPVTQQSQDTSTTYKILIGLLCVAVLLLFWIVLAGNNSNEKRHSSSSVDAATVVSEFGNDEAEKFYGYGIKMSKSTSLRAVGVNGAGRCTILEEVLAREKEELAGIDNEFGALTTSETSAPAATSGTNGDHAVNNNDLFDSLTFDNNSVDSLVPPKQNGMSTTNGGDHHHSASIGQHLVEADGNDDTFSTTINNGNNGNSTPMDTSSSAAMITDDNNQQDGDGDALTNTLSALPLQQHQAMRRMATPKPPPVHEEPAKIKNWREQQREQLEQKDLHEEAEKRKLNEQAKYELDEWYEKHDQKLHKTTKRNRDAEKQLMSQRESAQPGKEWERVDGMCEFNPKSARGAKDFLLQMKNQPQNASE